MIEWPSIAILSCSLSPRSRSRVLCTHARDTLERMHVPVLWANVAERRVLPHGMDGSEGLDEVSEALSEASGIIVGFPVYNYTMNSSLKAVIERMGRSFENKVVGLMMAAGGRSSYMSGMDVASSLMLDFRTWIVPRFVYATKDAFSEDRTRLESDEIGQRVAELSTAVATMAWRLVQAPPPT